MASAVALGLIWWSAQTTDYAGLPINALGQVVGDLLMMGIALPALSSRGRQKPKDSTGTSRDSALINCPHRSAGQTSSLNQPMTPRQQRQRPPAQLTAAPTCVALVRMHPETPQQMEAWISIRVRRRQLKREATSSLMVLAPIQLQTISAGSRGNDFRRFWWQPGYALLVATHVGEAPLSSSGESRLRAQPTNKGPVAAARQPSSR